MKAWRATEEKVARALGGRRHPRRYGVSPPDATAELGDARLVVEAKTRRKVPAIVRQALDQASGYALCGFGQVPVGVIREKGSRVAVAVLWLSNLAALAGAQECCSICARWRVVSAYINSRRRVN